MEKRNSNFFLKTVLFGLCIALSLALYVLLVTEFSYRMPQGFTH